MPTRLLMTSTFKVDVSTVRLPAMLTAPVRSRTASASTAATASAPVNLDEARVMVLPVSEMVMLLPAASVTDVPLPELGVRSIVALAPAEVDPSE